MFNTSRRNWNLTRSPIEKSLSSDESTLTDPGPSPKVRPASPNVYLVGAAKALVLNHSDSCWLRDRPPERSGLPTTFGRTPSENELVRLFSSTGLSGVPVRSSAITPSDQPPTTASSARELGAKCLPWPTG